MGVIPTGPECNLSSKCMAGSEVLFQKDDCYIKKEDLDGRKH